MTNYRNFWWEAMNDIRSNLSPSCGDDMTCNCSWSRVFICDSDTYVSFANSILNFMTWEARETNSSSSDAWICEWSGYHHIFSSNLTV